MENLQNEVEDQDVTAFQSDDDEPIAAVTASTPSNSDLPNAEEKVGNLTSTFGSKASPNPVSEATPPQHSKEHPQTDEKGSLSRSSIRDSEEPAEGKDHPINESTTADTGPQVVSNSTSPPTDLTGVSGIGGVSPAVNSKGNVEGKEDAVDDSKPPSKSGDTIIPKGTSGKGSMSKKAVLGTPADSTAYDSAGGVGGINQSQKSGGSKGIAQSAVTQSTNDVGTDRADGPGAGSSTLNVGHETNSTFTKPSLASRKGSRSGDEPEDEKPMNLSAPERSVASNSTKSIKQRTAAANVNNEPHPNQPIVGAASAGGRSAKTVVGGVVSKTAGDNAAGVGDDFAEEQGDASHAMKFDNVSSTNDISKIEVPFPRTTLNQRVRSSALKTGRPLPVPNVAALMIQASWRGKRVRKANRKATFAAIEIQRIYRGRKAVKVLMAMKKRHADLEVFELERAERLRRIRQQERELILLQRLPAEDSATFQRLKRQNSAKIVQRAWHRTVGRHWAKPAVAKKKRKPHEDGTSDLPEEETYWDNDPVLHHHRSNLSEGLTGLAGMARLRNPHPNYYASVAEKIAVDALGLAQVHRKIKDDADRKYRQREKEKEKNAFNFTLPADPSGGDDKNYKADLLQTKRINPAQERVGIRKKYQDLLENQQKASILLEEYHQSQDIRNARKVERLTSMGHCKHLVAQMAQPLSLEAARELIHSKPSVSVDKSGCQCGSGFLSWVGNLQIDGLQNGIDSHLRTSTAMRDKRRWGLVATPHDVTGPPIDIALLSRRKEAEERERYRKELESGRVKNRFGHLASAWADGSDVEESLMWVAYASQPRRYLTDLSAAQLEEGENEVEAKGENKESHVWASVGKRNTPAERAASDLIGEVDGEKLLFQLSKQALGATRRREEILQKSKEYNDRVDRLAKAFEDEALKHIHAKLAGVNTKILSENEKRKRYLAAARIQALMRGKRDRKLVSKLRAERRVLLALQNLMNELSRPEIKSSGISLGQIDSTLLNRVASLSASAGVSSSSSANRVPRQKQKEGGKSVVDPLPDRHGFTEGHHQSMATYHPSAGVSMADERVSSSQPRTRVEGNDAVFRQNDTPQFEVPSSQFDDSVSVSELGDGSPGQYSPRTAEIRRMYRQRTKFGSSKEAIAKLNKSKESLNTNPNLIIDTPDHSLSPARQTKEVTGRRTPTQSPVAQTPPGSGKAGGHGRQIYTPTASFLEGAGTAGGVSTGKSRSTTKKGKISRSSSASVHGTGTVDREDMLSELEESMDGYVSTPSVSQSGIADSMSSMFADFTAGGTNIHSPRPKGGIVFGSSVKGLQFDGPTPTAGAAGSSTGLMSFPHSAPPSVGSVYQRSARPFSANYGHASHVSLHIPRMSSQTLQALGRAADCFKRNQCRASNIVDSAMLASMSQFDKGEALYLLKDIVSCCGVEQMRIWLEEFVDSGAALSLEASTGSINTAMSESYRKLPDLTLKAAANLLVELGFQLNVLDDNDASKYRLINLCMLLRLLSAGSSGRVKLAEVMMLAEDMWLIESAADGISVSFLLAQSRYSLLHESTKSSLPVSVLYGKLVLKAAGKSELSTTDSHDSLLAATYLDVTMVSSLFLTLGLRIHESEALAVIRLVEGSEEAVAVRSDNLRSYLCTLCSFRTLQTRLKVWFRAVPNMLPTVYKEVATQIGTNADMGAVSFEKFCEAVQMSNIPLSESETFMLAKLFSRSNSSVLNDTGTVDAKLLDSVRKGEILSIRLQ